MSALSRLAALQQQSFEQLRSSTAEGAAVIELVEQFCVLQVARLTSATSFLEGYAEAVVDLVSQFLPGTTVTVGAVPLGDGGEWIWIGTMAEPLRAELVPLLQRSSVGERVCCGETSSVGMYIEGDLVGCLALSGAPTLVLESSLLTHLSEQVAVGLAVVITTEQLRREAAVSTLSKTLVGLGESYGPDDLAQFANELALLKGARAVLICFENPLLGGRIEVAGGEQLTAPSISRGLVVDDRLPLSIEVGHWSSIQPGDLAQLTEFVDLFIATLSRVEETRRLRGESETDSLTGVGNRRAALKALAVSVDRARRTGEQVALLLLDLDHFKSVNDTFGHYIGDNLLVAVARGIASALRPFDTVARVGGEEFLVICPGTDWPTAEAIAERLLQLVPALAESELPDRHAQTISVGIALFPDTAATAEVLMRRVDDALYEAKRAGRNQSALAGQASRLAVPGAATRRLGER